MCTASINKNWHRPDISDSFWVRLLARRGCLLVRSNRNDRWVVRRNIDQAPLTPHARRPGDRISAPGQAGAILPAEDRSQVRGSAHLGVMWTIRGNRSVGDLSHCNLGAVSPLGKGEVLSSVLSGSTSMCPISRGIYAVVSEQGHLREARNDAGTIAALFGPAETSGIPAGRAHRFLKWTVMKALSGSPTNPPAALAATKYRWLVMFFTLSATPQLGVS
jgi:hypothetical protein